MAEIPALVYLYFRLRFPRDPQAAELMGLPIHQSSANEYQRKWAEFLASLRQEGVNLVTQCILEHLASFLTMLFYKKGLLASTIAHYCSALSVPLHTVLSIDVLDPAVSGMIRAMSLRRPTRPLTALPGI